MLHPNSNETTPREFDSMQHEKDMYELQAGTELKLKELELALAKEEARWSSWLRIPVTIIKLPVYMLLAIGYIITSFRKGNEPGDKFWEIIKK